ncbi:MAG: hypothetical protein Q9191_000540 [Dirinaria sp. TL-2023a]
MPSERVLVCGAGPAGSILAYWLARNDFQVVVIERSRSEQKAGQGIEIEEPALTVVKAMGVLDKLQEKKTGEKGFKLEDAQARSYGVLDAGDGISPTGALELMRGDLTEVLYHAANELANVAYRFETTLHSIRQTPEKAIVDLENRNTKAITSEEFDLVVGADGVGSRTRQLVMGSPEKLGCFKRVGAFVAYFSIPKQDRDWPYSRVCHFPGRRIVWTRPTGKEYGSSKVTSVAFIKLSDDIPSLRRANAAGERRKQKEAFADIYSGLGWETPRILEGMMETDNFYSDELVQVKLPKWSENRVALVGDAAWAPSPFTGEGNQLAIIGAWVLAQELSRNRNVTAFEMYEKRFRSYVEECQVIPLRGYAPYLLNPQTSLGIWILRTIYSIAVGLVNFVAWTKVTKMFPERENFAHPAFDLQMKKVP